MIATGVDIEPRELMASTVQRVEPSKDQLLEILTLLGYRTQGCRRVGASRGPVRIDRRHQLRRTGRHWNPHEFSSPGSVLLLFERVENPAPGWSHEG